MATDTAPWEDFAPEPPASSGNAAPWDDFKPAPPGIGADPDSAMGAVMAQGLGPHADKSLKDTLADVASHYGVGLAGGANRMAVQALSVEPPRTGRPMVSTPQQRAQQERETVAPMRDDLAAYEARLKSGELGVPGMLGDMTPEVALSAFPIARAGRSMLPLATRMLGQRAAPLAADVAANAGYSGGKSALQGNGVPDVMRDAGMGALGAAAGRVVGNVAGRALGGITDDAAQLLKAGVTPTYGQAFGGNGIVATAERLLKKLPLAGAAADAAKRRAMGQYSEAEITQALKATGIPHDGSGFNAVAQVNDAINDAFNAVKPHLELPFFSRPQAVNDAVRQIRSDLPLLSGENAATFNKFVQARILNRSGNPLDRIDGEAFKDLDREIGEAIRSRLRGTPTANDREMAQALRILQSSIRARVAPVAGAPPEVLQQLQQYNTAFRQMVPINIATERATGGAKGAFSPDQFAAAAKQAGVPRYDPRLDLNRAARETLNDSGTGLTDAISRNAIGIGGHGGASAVALSMGVPAEAVLAGNAAVALGGAGVAHALYSEPGIRLMLGSMNLIPSVAKWIVNQPFVKQQEFVHRMLVESPAATKQLAAQVGRHLAEQQRQPETQ